MSQWGFGKFKTEIDFTDADFLERLEEAQVLLDKESGEVPKVGRNSDIIRSQVTCFAHFFDTLFGEGTSDQMYGERMSLELAMRSCEEFTKFGKNEDRRIGSVYGKYRVNQGGGRQQRHSNGPR